MIAARIEELKRLGWGEAEICSVSFAELERALDVMASAARAGISPRSISRPALTALFRAYETLADVYTPEGVEIWMHARNMLLDARRPFEILTDPQLITRDYFLVQNVIEQLVSGAAS